VFKAAFHSVLILHFCLILGVFSQEEGSQNSTNLIRNKKGKFSLIFKYFFFGVPHLATFISFFNVIASFAYTIQYTAPGFEPTTTQL
jgi:hypothetical protein